MIVLTKPQRDLFLLVKEPIQQELLDNRADYIPIEMKGDLWILPDEILLDSRFDKLKKALKNNGEFDKYINRDVDKSELIINEP